MNYLHGRLDSQVFGTTGTVKSLLYSNHGFNEKVNLQKSRNTDLNRNTLKWGFVPIEVRLPLEVQLLLEILQYILK